MEQRRQYCTEQPRASSNTTPYFIELNYMDKNQYLQEKSLQLNTNLSAPDENEQYSTSTNIPRFHIVPKEELIDEKKVNKNTKRSTKTQQSSKRCRNP